MIFTIYDPTGARAAGVNLNNELQVGLNTNKELAGYARMAALGPDGAFSDIAVTEDGTVEVSQPTLCFSDTIEGTAVNTNKWDPAVVTMTITQAAGYINLNAGVITTINTNASLPSVDSFSVIPEFPLHVHFTIKTPNVPQTNAVMEVGIGADINGNRVKNATAIHDGVILLECQRAVCCCHH